MKIFTVKRQFLYLVDPEADGVFLLPLSDLLSEGDDHGTPGLGVVRVWIRQSEDELGVPHEVTWEKHHHVKYF